jgi:two-component system cell cycle sensor histidine kinase/response regulator CckA
MLHQELPAIDSSPLGRSARWLTPVLLVAAGLSIALVLLVIGVPLAAGGIAIVGAVAAAIAYFREDGDGVPASPLVIGPDYSLLGSALGLSREPINPGRVAGALLVLAGVVLVRRS